MDENIKKTILIVDDTKPIRIMLLKKLEHDYRCLLASEPREAVKILKEYRNEVGLIISDYEMPGMNGFEFLKGLKKLNISIPIIMVSGALNKIRIEELLRLGVKKFMAKPVIFNRLKEEIMKILDD